MFIIGSVFLEEHFMNNESDPYFNFYQNYVSNEELCHKRNYRVPSMFYQAIIVFINAGNIAEEEVRVPL